MVHIITIVIPIYTSCGYRLKAYGTTGWGGYLVETFYLGLLAAARERQVHRVSAGGDMLY